MIVDRFGEPLTFDKSLQTQSSEDLTRMSMRAPEHPVEGLTPAKIATLLRDAENGNLAAQADLAQDMQNKNAHLFSEIAKRRRGLTLLNWELKPPADATPQEEVDTAMIEEIIRGSDWSNDVVFNATDAILKGYSCQEIEWHEEGALIVPKEIHFRTQAMFKTAQTARNTLVIDDNTEFGLPMNPFGWITHIAPSMSGYISEMALSRVLVWPFIFASYPMRDLLEFLEVYGLPMRMGTYPAGATESEKTTLLRAIMSIGRQAGGIIPRGTEIKFENAADGQSEQFLSVVEYAEKLMSKAILGGTLTTQADGKSSTNALGVVHEEARKELRNSDVSQLEPTLTRDLVYPLWVLNAKSFKNPKRAPRWEFDVSEAEDVQIYADSIPKLAAGGMRIPLKWAHEKLQIPEAAEGEAVFTVQAPIQQNYGMLKNEPAGAIAALKAGAHSLDPAQTALDNAIDSITNDDYQKTMDPMIEPIVTAILKNGLDEARKLIPEIYENMDRSAMTEMLTRAIFVADLWGQANAKK